LKTPISPVRWTCVPPQSSLLKSGHGDHAHLVAVFFAEQSHCAGGDGLFERQHLGFDAAVAQDLFVHQPLHFLDFRLVHGGIVREIETQARRLHHAARLLDMRAQHLPQRGVQQVRGGVIAHGGEAQRPGDFRAQFVAHADGRGRDDAMHGEARHRWISRLHVGGFLAAQHEQAAAVAHLAAGFGIERRAVEHQLGFHARADFVAQLALDQQARDARGGGEVFVAQELGAALLDQFLIGGGDGAFVRALPTCAGALALALHFAVEALPVDGQAAVARHVFLLVERQAEGVVQLEGHRAGNHMRPASDFTSSLKTRSATRKVLA
jgi:hypothetical protein